MLIVSTYLGYLIGMTAASFSRHFAFSNPLMLSHLTSISPTIISLLNNMNELKFLHQRFLEFKEQPE